MGRTKKVGSTGRFGPRFGATLRKRVRKIEDSLHGTYKCPSCFSLKVRRKAVGIWTCQKCDYTFAGGAYIPFTARAKKAINQAERSVATE